MTDSRDKPNSPFKSKAPFKRGSKPDGKHPSAKRDAVRAGFKPQSRPSPKDSRPPPKISSKSTLHVDLGQIKANYDVLTELVKKPGKPVTIAAVVKADAYGLGMGPIAKALYGHGCRTFFVALPSEGRLLREIIGPQASIYVLNGPSEAEMPMFFAMKLKPVLNSMYQIGIWMAAVEKNEFKPRSAIMIDTGMNRLGFKPHELEALTADKALVDSLDLDLIMSHLACGDTPDHEMNAHQLAAFKKAAASLPPVAMSLSNSAGIYLGKDYHFNMVRSGGALYGVSITEYEEQHRPVATLASPILQIGHVKKGETAGYRASFKAERDTKTITLAIGYADGMPVAGSDQVSYGTYMKQRLPIIGRVSMDLTILDATDFEGPLNIGDRINFLAHQLEEQAEAMGLLNYDLLTRLGTRFRREYHKGRDRS